MAKTLLDPRVALDDDCDRLAELPDERIVVAPLELARELPPKVRTIVEPRVRPPTA